MKLLARARPEILALQPYASARMEAGHAAIMLNANESPWAMAGDTRGLNRYPDPQPLALRDALALLYAVDAGNVLIGRGSDEAIDLLVRAFCTAGSDSIVIATPTFGMYAVAARIQGARVIEVPLADDFTADAEAMLDAITADTKLLFVCTPNNPTGNLVPLATIARLANELRDRAVVVVDEAYLEFAANAQSASTLLAANENVAVLRTLSKAHALAGARIGTVIAAPPLIEMLRRIQAPYPLPTAAVEAALAALSARALQQTSRRIEIVRSERERLARALAAMPGVLAVYPSAANFLCVRCADSRHVYARLLRAGIVVRDVSRYPRLRDCLRISIGNSDENAAVLATLASVERAA